jgi:phospholipase C
MQQRVTVLAGTLLALLCAITGSACSSASAKPGPGKPPCGTSDSPPPTYDHVVWVVLENHSFEDLLGTGEAPYLDSLAAACGVATNAWAVTHPSLPNYLAMVSGRTGGVNRTCTPAQCPQRRRTLFDQVRANGGSWRVLAESMPTPCRRTDAYPYVVRHNPPTYFPGLAAACRQWDRPMGTATAGRLVTMVREGRLPTFLLVVPNQCHNAHDCAIGAGDDWLARIVPLLTNGPDYREGRTAVFVTWDEGAGGHAGQNCRAHPDRSCHIVTAVVSPTTVPGTRSATFFDHYSLLETTEQLLGIRTHLGHAADDRTRTMRRPFGL